MFFEKSKQYFSKSNYNSNTVGLYTTVYGLNDFRHSINMYKMMILVNLLKR